MEDREDQEERGGSRSPNYPAFGLPKALERARALYDKDGKAAVTTVAAVKAWGYNTLNGRSLRSIAALRQYGLLDDTGPKMVRLSQAALTIMLSPPTSPDRVKALGEVARKPAIFGTLWDQYADGFPSDESMVNNLIINSNYGPDAARKLIAAFRETIDLVGVGHEVHISGEDGAKKTEGDARTEKPERKPKGRGDSMPDIGRPALDIPFPIVSGGEAILRVPRSMSEDDYTMLTTLIETMLKGMKRALTAPTKGASDGEAEEA
ncbi:MAG: hypothetical protein KGL37_05825 [Acidobacteriota bacterium]|nr:hypothetical protein [Acidobacteriota bacterium]